MCRGPGHEEKWSTVSWRKKQRGKAYVMHSEKQAKPPPSSPVHVYSACGATPSPNGAMMQLGETQQVVMSCAACGAKGPRSLFSGSQLKRSAATRRCLRCCQATEEAGGAAAKQPAASVVAPTTAGSYLTPAGSAAPAAASAALPPRLREMMAQSPGAQEPQVLQQLLASPGIQEALQDQLSSGGPAHTRLPRGGQPGAAPSAAAGAGSAGGYLFFCSGKTVGECFSRSLFGCAQSDFASMEEIKQDTTLLLFNFSTRTLVASAARTRTPLLLPC